MNVNPSTSFEAVAKFPTGLTGTLGVRIIDNAGATTIARVTAGIAEYPAGSGIYAKTLTSPGTAGQYTIVWDDADDHWAVEDLLVTTEETSAIIGSGHLYVTADDLKEILAIANETYADLAIQIAVNTASRSVDGYTGARFYTTSEVRYFTPGWHGQDAVFVTDIVSITTLEVDTDDDGTYDETWVQDTDFFLDPPNAIADGLPFTELVLNRRIRSRFPTSRNCLKVTGSFGWAATPWQVTQAAVLLANRFLTRTRSAPLGILVSAANDVVAQARLGRIDPDVAFLLDQVPDSKPSLTSVQLG
jgi:hypothetical protein